MRVQQWGSWIAYEDAEMQQVRLVSLAHPILLVVLQVEK
jgi:hypothetical protein